MITINLGDKFRAKKGFEQAKFGDCEIDVVQIFDDKDRGTINELYKITAANKTLLTIAQVRYSWLTAYFEKVDQASSNT